MLRKKHSEPAQPDSQQALLEFETPADQPGKKDPKQFFKKNWKKITAVVCVAAVAVAVLLPLVITGMEMSVVPSLDSVAVAFGISVGIGVLFGYLPAKRAARLNPIEALRCD